MPKVSIIIPTYNRESYICEAIDSVLNQTYQDFEIIVVDDGSTDDSKEVLLQYNNKIRYFYKENGGAASARNFAIRKAEGEYIAFLDSDDVWLPEKLKVQMNIIEKNINVGIVYTAMSVIGENGNGTGQLKPTHPAQQTKDFLKGGRIPPTVLIRKSLFNNYGFFDESIRVGEDTDMWLRLSMHTKIKFIEQPLAKYRRYAGNISSDIESAYRGHIIILQKLLNDNPSEISKYDLRTKLAKTYYILGKVQYQKNKYKDTLFSLLASLKSSKVVGLYFLEKECSFIKRVVSVVKPYVVLLICSTKYILSVRPRKKTQGMRRILYYEPSSGFGGSARSLSTLINNLDINNYQPYILAKCNSPYWDEIKGVQIKSLKIYKEPLKLSLFKFVKHVIKNVLPEVICICAFIKKKKISLVHVNTNVISGIPAIIASTLSGVPCVCHVRQTKPFIKRERFFARLIERLIFLNREAIELNRRWIKNDKLELLYDGIDFRRYYGIVDNEDIRNEFSLDNNFVVSTVGNLLERKGQEVFIKAAQRISQHSSRTRFMIIGKEVNSEKKYGQKLRKLCADLGLKEKVIFTGWRNDIPEVTSCFDIAVQASIFPEGFGLTCIEAMALSKPLIATNIPGPSEIVVDGVTGLLVPPGNPQALAEAIIKLLDNPELARRMGEAGRKRAEELFDIKKNIKKLEDIYSAVLNKRR